MTGPERHPADDLWRDLAGVGRMTMPDLGQEYQELESGIIVPAQLAPEPHVLPKAMGLFVGAGGMDCGFHQAGWHVVAAQELWLAAAETYLFNLGSPETVVHVGRTTLPDAPKKDRLFFDKHGGRSVPAGEIFGTAGTGWISSRQSPPHQKACEHFFLGDIRKLDTEDVLAALEMEPGKLDCIAGGPPCQGFSHLGKRQVMDPRNSLVFEFCRFIVEMKPKTMVMENVPGILTMVTPEGVPVIDAICRVLEDGGFGAFDALRRSLTGMPAARGAVRGRQKEDNLPMNRAERRRKAREKTASAEPAQGDLF